MPDEGIRTRLLSPDLTVAEIDGIMNDFVKYVIESVFGTRLVVLTFVPETQGVPKESCAVFTSISR